MARVSVSLRVFSKLVHPEEIVYQVGFEPKWKRALGQPRYTPDGISLSGEYTENFCSFPMPNEKDEDLSETLARCCEMLSNKSRFFEHVKETGGRVEFFIGLFIDEKYGDVFEHKLLLDIARLNVDISIDIYHDPN